MNAQVDLSRERAQMLNNLLTLAYAQDPTAVYAAFLHAVRRRDADGVLGTLAEDYGAALRRYRSRPKFAHIFELWCEQFPAHVETTACYVDGDTAVLETRHEVNGHTVHGRITMVHEQDDWRIASERCAGDRTRVPVAGFLPNAPSDDQATVASSG